MQRSVSSFFISAVKILLLSTAFMPLAAAFKSFFPFIVGKMLFFRGGIEAGLVVAFLYLAYAFLIAKEQGFRSVFPRAAQYKKLFYHPVTLALALFFISLLLSTVFAASPYRAFWGDLERAEGFFGLVHFFLFFILALVFFEKRDWVTYFKLSIIAGFILIWYALLQYFGVQRFPFALLPSVRPDSYIGNSAFLGTHMLFLILFSILVIKSAKKSEFWFYAGYVSLILSFSGVFITNTRGALLGLVAGLLFLLCYFAV